MRDPTQHMIFLIISLILTSCSKDKISYCGDNEPLYLHSDFPIGTAISTDLLQYHSRYREITINQFNRISGETAWLYDRVHPHKDIYSWSDYDALVQFAETYNKEIIGASLVYHNYLPYWLVDFHGSKQDWEAILKDHIQTIVSNYRGKINAWIVVNEAFRRKAASTMDQFSHFWAALDLEHHLFSISNFEIPAGKYSIA